MNWVDLFIIIVLIAAVINGARRGLFREIVTVAAIGIGIIFAINYCDWFAERIAGMINLPPHLLFTVSLLSIFVIALVAARFLAILLYKMVSPAALKGTDRLGGGLVGALKGVFILGLIFTLFIFLPVFGKFNVSIDESIFAPTIRQVIPKLYDYTTIIHPTNKSFTSKVRKIMAPKRDSEIEIAKKEGEKTINTSGDEVMNNVEKYFGEDNSANMRKKR